jgi:hypothetical protein
VTVGGRRRRRVLTGDDADIEYLTALGPDAIGVFLIHGCRNFIEAFVRRIQTVVAASLVGGIDAVLASHISGHECRHDEQNTRDVPQAIAHLKCRFGW